jgi:endonuclease/exonuclease/phosphatase (EEP) superfamily protein YafD
VAAGGTRARPVELTAWLTVGVVGTITLAQALGWAGAGIIGVGLAVTQSLTPYLAVVLVPVTAWALWRRRLVLATVASAAMSGLLVLGTPLAFPDAQPAAHPASIGLDVAAVNLWYQSDRIDEVDEALAAVDADVIVFNEYTAEHEAVLLATPLASEYRHRSGTSGPRADGIVVWSRFPLRVLGELDAFYGGLDVNVAGPDGDVRLVAMHMATPIDDFDAWRDDLAIAADVGRHADSPTLLIGDLNASYWHPDFRRLLDAGFVDAHTSAGEGFSTSWPTNWAVPPFVRLDHGLTTGGLVSTDVDDFEVPGSDHAGFVVSVAPAR